MPDIEVIVFLLVVIIGFSALVDKLRVPQAIMLVIAGLIIGFAPQLPDVILKPGTVFLVFLPPLLYTAAFKLPWHNFKAQRRSIISLSTGLVFFTIVAIAIVAHYFIPGFTWQLGFVLGAVIAPSDAVAATSITKGLNLNKRVVTILEGESLVNDASALVAYRYAIASVVTGTFIFWNAGVQFIWVAIGGTAIGLLIGWCLVWVHKFIRGNATLEVALTLLTPYTAYLLAEQFHLSGVLAVVAAGLFISYKSPETFSYRARIQAYSFWETIEFLLNGFVFILIGMQLPAIVDNIEKSSLLNAVGYGVLITTVAVLVRIIWVFPGAYIPYWLSSKEKKHRNNIDWRDVAIISWTGMRGVVSLASALAIPLTLADGKDFPQREMILFITFCAIFLTLMVNGLTLRSIIKLLKIPSDHLQEQEEENNIRKQIAKKVLTFIDTELISETTSKEVITRLRINYDSNLRPADTGEDQDLLEPGASKAILQQYTHAQKNVIEYERALLIQMHKHNETSSELIRKLEHELDIEESRLNAQIGRLS